MGKLRTGSDIQEKGADPAPAGEFYYRKTNKVKLPAPQLTRSGHIDKKTVWVTRGDDCWIRVWVNPVQPNTDRQLSQNDRMKLAQEKWMSLSVADRDGWQAFALEHVFNDRPFKARGNAGQNAYSHAQTFLLGQGLPLGEAPPTELPPPALLSLEEVPAPIPGAFAFRVRHNIADPDGLRILFELTPGTVSPKRAPYDWQLAWSGETSADSFLPLGPDGANYLLDRARFVIAPDQRYAARIRAITSDGLTGPSLRAAFHRLAPEEPAPELDGGSGG